MLTLRVSDQGVQGVPGVDGVRVSSDREVVRAGVKSTSKGVANSSYCIDGIRGAADFMNLSDLLCDFWLRRRRGETTDVALRSHREELECMTGSACCRKIL